LLVLAVPAPPQPQTVAEILLLMETLPTGEEGEPATLDLLHLEDREVAADFK
jgi:hypothetical protein